MFYIFFVGVILSPILSKANVTALGVTTKAQEFQQYLKTRPGTISLKDALIHKKIKKADKYIKSKHSLAVKGLLLEDLTPSKYLFKELTESKKRHLLSSKSKSLISESYYRLSNLERTKSNFWIKEGLLFDLNYTPSSNIFNPEIINSFNSLTDEISNYFFDFDVKKIANSDTNVFINGSLILNKVKVHPSSMYHLNLFKEGYKIKSFKVSGQELARSKKVRLSSFDFGTCKIPKFKSNLGIKVTEIFFSKDCIKKYSQNIKIADENIPLPIFISKKAFNKKNNSNLLKKRSFLNKKSTWIIIAGTVVASAIIYSLANREKDVKIVPVQK